MEEVFKRGPGRPRKPDAAPDSGKGLKIKLLKKTQFPGKSRATPAGEVVLVDAETALRMIGADLAVRADDYTYEDM